MTLPKPATAVAPTLQRLYLTSNASDITHLSSGDVFKIVTDAPMTQPLVGATITIGAVITTPATVLTNSVATATAAGSATFTVNTAAEVVDGVSQAAGTVLTVKMLANPIDVESFGVACVLQDSTGIANPTGDLVIGTGAALTKDVVS